MPKKKSAVEALASDQWKTARDLAILMSSLGLVALIIAIGGRQHGWLIPAEATLLAAIAFSCFAGFGPSWFLKKVTPPPEPPEGVDESLWVRLLGRTDAGPWIGAAERLLVIAAIVAQVPTLIAAWFAFKLASKWEVWKNVIQVPPELSTVGNRDWLIARNVLGSWLLNRFWLGTILNVLAGMVAFYLGSLVGGLRPH